MIADLEPWCIRVADLRQLVWCARIPYYSYVLPVERKITVKMAHGDSAHIRLEALERRRTLKRYHLTDGERTFRVPVRSERLGLQGIVDLVLRTAHEVIPVEFKMLAREASLHHKYQLAAYAMLIEDCWRCTVRRGFLYLVDAHDIVPVEMTDGVRRRVTQLKSRICAMAANQVLPPPTPHRARCRDCEFRHYCADID